MSDDATDEDRTSSQARVTIRLADDAEKMRETLEGMACSLAALRSQAEVPVARFAETQRGITEAVEQFGGSLQRLQDIAEQSTENWPTAIRRLRRTVELASAASERLNTIRFALDSPALEAARAAAESREALKTTLEALLGATAGGTGIADPNAAATRFVDEVARPPERTSDADAFDHVVDRARVAEEAQGVPRLGTLLAIVAILVGLEGRLSTRREHAGLRRGHEQVIEVMEEVVKQRRTTEIRPERFRQCLQGEAGADDGPKTTKADSGERMRPDGG